jgi:hypothetical protein
LKTGLQGRDILLTIPEYGMDLDWFDARVSFSWRRGMSSQPVSPMTETLGRAWMDTECIFVDGPEKGGIAHEAYNKVQRCTTMVSDSGRSETLRRYLKRKYIPRLNSEIKIKIHARIYIR